MAPWMHQQVRIIDFLYPSTLKKGTEVSYSPSDRNTQRVAVNGVLFPRLCGNVDRHGQHGVRLSDVHRARGQRYNHDRQHRPGGQGVQEQGTQ